MTVKEVAKEVLEQAPNNCSWDELMDDLRLQKELEISRQQSERGEGIPLDEVARKIPQWVKNATT